MTSVHGFSFSGRVLTLSAGGIAFARLFSQFCKLESDRSETNNLTEKMPHKTKKMEIMWKNWANKANVLTWKKFQAID